VESSNAPLPSLQNRTLSHDQPNAKLHYPLKTMARNHLEYQHTVDCASYDRPNRAITPAAANTPTETCVVLPSEVGVDPAASAFPIVIGKPAWPAHIVLKKSPIVFWSLGFEQAFGNLFFAALMMLVFLHMQAASVVMCSVKFHFAMGSVSW
jgi:hypothetical protein